MTNGTANAATDEVDDRVNGSHLPRVGPGRAVDSKFDRKGEVGSVGPGLVPPLHAAVCERCFRRGARYSRRPNGTHDNAVPEPKGAVELVVPLIREGFAFVKGKFGEAPKGVRVPSDERCT